MAEDTGGDYRKWTVCGTVVADNYIVTVVLSPTMAVETLLVPVDGSEQSEKALEVALNMAREFDSDVINVLYVVDTSLYGEPALSAVEVVTDNVQTVGEQLVEDIRDRATALGIELETDVHHGRPKEEIVSGAEANDADLVVIGQTGDDAWGPICKHVVKNCPCNVLVV